MSSSRSIRIDQRSAMPAYRQIVDALRTRLVEGDLPVGHALPPVRRLAIELGVHFNTVAQAYRELAAEGWLDVQHGRGATVIERGRHVDRTEQTARQWRDRLRALVAEMRAHGVDSSRIAHELRLVAQGLDQ